MRRLDEFALIRRLTKSGQAGDSASMIEVGIGDDAAVASLGNGMRLVSACDTMVETVHFNRWTMSPEDVGYKALAANVSDIAAMGGIPKYALVSISVPAAYSVRKLERVYEGLYHCARRYGLVIIGGDTTSSPRHFVIAVTVLGEVEPNQALLRSAARPGQAVFITGYPGQSAAGLHYLQQQRKAQPYKPADHLKAFVSAHQQPAPSVRAGRLLLESGACGALNDVSDGLASELYEISEASGYGLVIREGQLPRADGLEAFASSQNMNVLDWMLFGGEDYHLVGTVDRTKLQCVQSRFAKENVPFFVIGEVASQRTKTDTVQMIKADGQAVRIEKKGYHHF